MFTRDSQARIWASERNNPAHFRQLTESVSSTAFRRLPSGLTYDRFPPPFPNSSGLPCWGCDRKLPWGLTVKTRDQFGKAHLDDAHCCDGPDILDYPAFAKLKKVVEAIEKLETVVDITKTDEQTKL